MSSDLGQSAPEEAIAQDRKLYLVGRFKVFLNQTKNHPEQRSLDQSWVDCLVEKIGDPTVLNRALHPIGVILEDDSVLPKLQQASNGHPNTEVPLLPQGVNVLVFAGQHRLAMLSQLGLHEPDHLWWHADVYMKALELKHPAEFLTMMYESNTPKIMKVAGDVDLFRAVVKLKDLLDSKAIKQEAFLRNRRALLNFDTNTSRCISNLTRNNDLAHAILEALSKIHIANVFSAGSWRRLTTGRLYVVSVGIIKEMVKQVDLLCEGMIEVPKEALSLQASQCRISSLEGFKDRKKKASHVWDALPGGFSAALARARRRPVTFVSELNPKTRDPWSLPELVLLPSCMGAGVVEDELKIMKGLMQHLLKMTCKPEHLERYTSSLPDTLEIDTDHPAGIIAYLLREVHADNPKAIGYECKIIQATWSHRAELTKELEAHHIPEYQQAKKEDYEKLLKKSKPWWDILHLFRIRRFPFGLKLEVSKHFVSEKAHINKDKDPVSQIPASNKCSQTPGTGSLEAPPKRLKGNGSTSFKKPKATKASQQTAPLDEGKDEEEDEDEDKDKDKGEDKDEDEDEDEDVANAETHYSNAILVQRGGGNRRLGKAIADLNTASEDMSRAESRALSELLETILEVRPSSKFQELVESLIMNAKGVNKEGGHQDKSQNTQLEDFMSD